MNRKIINITFIFLLLVSMSACEKKNIPDIQNGETLLDKTTTVSSESAEFQTVTSQDSVSKTSESVTETFESVTETFESATETFESATETFEFAADTVNSQEYSCNDNNREKSEVTNNKADNSQKQSEDTEADSSGEKGSDNSPEFLSKYGYSEADISDSLQIITVESSGSLCTVTCFEKNNGKWGTVLESRGFVGLNGVSQKSREGDNRTPAGMFSLGTAFGTDQLTISYPYRLVNENCYWVDDDESELYNQWVETENITWNSAEHLIDYPDSYRYAVAINYNTSPVIPGAGSAIFLHCSNGSPTAGCISVPESDMKFILEWLSEKAAPLIMIK